MPNWYLTKVQQKFNGREKTFQQKLLEQQDIQRQKKKKKKKKKKKLNLELNLLVYTEID